jgi:hypothetical protein
MGGSGGGNNQLQGGTGDDWYVLDAFDTCVEFVGEGIDTVEARVGSYTLGNNVENLLYTGPGKFVGNGNALDNVHTGGDQNDILRGKGGNDTIHGGLGTDEVQLRGLAAQYTITAEGSGYRIVDSVAGRDGSTFVDSVEVLRFVNNATTILTYPPAAPASLETGAKDGALVSPLIDDGDGFGPLVSPAEGDGVSGKNLHGLQVLPHLDDGFLLAFGDGGPGDHDIQVLPVADAFVPLAAPDEVQVLPAIHDDGPLVLPGQANADAELFVMPFDGQIVMGPVGPILVDSFDQQHLVAHDPWA